MSMKERIILDLCGGTGAWSKPYRDAGYDVRLITLPEQDVRSIEPCELPQPVYGVLAAPPCDHFAVSGAQYWKIKDGDGRTKEFLDIAHACLDIIEYAEPVFWAIENPVGRFGKLLAHRLSDLHQPADGSPIFTFDPFQYSGYADVPEKEAYTKKTCLWGNFWPPKAKPTEPKRGPNGKYITPIWKVGGKSARTKEIRSITPSGFARAFFKANP